MIAMFRSIFDFPCRHTLVKLLIFLLVSISFAVHTQTRENQVAYLENIYRLKSDQELSDLLARWGSLSSLERRVLLAETRGRLAGAQKVRKSDSGKIGVQVQRRYGQTIRRPDGSTLVLKAQVTNVTKTSKNRTLSGKSPKGVSNNRLVLQPSSITNLPRTEQSRSGVVRVTYGAGFERRVTNKVSEQQSERVGGDEKLKKLEVRK